MSGRPRCEKGKYMDWKRIAHAPAWIWSEIIWYIKWWSNKFYSFGEWILGIGVKLIDLHDQFWDEIEENIREAFHRGLD